MQSCCIRGCDSYKESPSKNIGYFKFPLYDVYLLKKWLRQINRPGWDPLECSQICSAHFRESDFQRIPSQNLFFLLPYSVPTIFPFDSKKLVRRKKRRMEESLAVEARREIVEELVPHRNKVSLLRKKTKPATVDKPNEPDDSINLNTTNVVLSPVKMVSSSTLKRDKPVLQITINKKINTLTSSSSSKPQPFETIYLPYHEEKEDNPDIVRVENNGSRCSGEYPHIDDMEIVMIDYHRGSKLLEQSAEQCSQIDDIEIVEVDEDPGSSKQPTIQLQDHRYSREIRSNNSKYQKESEDLGRRLEELRERRKEEQLKIVRLQMDLLEVEKKMKDNNSEEIIVPNLGSGSKGFERNKSNWLLREKEEYENLLKDVREIKLKVLRERHDRELDKIRRLQAQMTNLGKKMRENDEKEIALSNLRAMSNSVAVRPDWMKREEEEYEKLLEDVRKIKEIYRLRRKSKDKDFGSNDTTAQLKTEKIISDEDCVIIETMQRNDAHLVDDDDDEYGEVIGEIDEDSIDIDITKEETICFNDELPDPGLLEA